MSIISVYDVFLNEDRASQEESKTPYTIGVDPINSVAEVANANTDEATLIRLSEYREHSSNSAVIEALDKFNASSSQGEVAMNILTAMIDPVVEKSLADFRVAVKAYVEDSLETKVARVREKPNPSKLPPLDQKLSLASDNSSSLSITELKNQLDANISVAVNEAIAVVNKELTLNSSGTPSNLEMKVAKNPSPESSSKRLDLAKSNPITAEVINAKWTDYMKNKLGDLGEKFLTAELLSDVQDIGMSKITSLANTLSNGLSDLENVVDYTKDSVSSLAETIMDEIIDIGSLESAATLPSRIADIANDWVEYGRAQAKSAIQEISNSESINAVRDAVSDIKSSISGFLKDFSVAESKSGLINANAPKDPYQLSRASLDSMMTNKNLASTFDWCIWIRPPEGLWIPTDMKIEKYLFYPVLGYELSEGALMSHSASKVGVDIKLPSGYLRPNRLSLTLPDMYYNNSKGVPLSRSLLRTLKDGYLSFIRRWRRTDNTNLDFRLGVFEITVIKLNPARKDDSRVFQKTYLCIPDISITDSGNSTKTPVIETINFTIVGEKRL